MKCPNCDGSGEVDFMNLPERVKFLRLKKKLSAKELGTKVGMSGQRICDLESDRGFGMRLTTKTLLRLSEGLGVDPSFLLEGLTNVES